MFRPCIDLHDGKVKQIVGGTLSESTPDTLKTNFVSRLVLCSRRGGTAANTKDPVNPQPTLRVFIERRILLAVMSSSSAQGMTKRLGRRLGLGQVSSPLRIQSALLDGSTGGLQIGGGITTENAQIWLDAGASKVRDELCLVQSTDDCSRLQQLSGAIGKDRLVVDVSCRKRAGGWVVAMNKWQDLTDMQVSKDNLEMLSEYCSEFLVHAADVEGLCQGIDEELVQKLGEWVQIPCTYAGGAKSIEDLESVRRLSGGKVDLTYGSSLDIFGGTLVKFEELVAGHQSDC
ncbi:1-(5-phosphoribosyl)-5-[(5-phosphoribosylamino)methylideneamino] imidazole-4-carboxamide isomerase [Mycena chlorophos]|uniref:1-(5-phosphoribosyl)-5-[(5-phosphoribosylamino)methylideneamino] imidazole-4-carboxamide isomerase n=1 Tax=Mycena chlorophos TaxID=658473 RepID=A0A8H6S5L1_MYCCL|nr:1-(5-phosphoribosyl)-5-[(5-phosphoribosylamino)methylideneamino] imidazole-4-carboxamide isomerase [Mycena chlorophos]